MSLRTLHAALLIEGLHLCEPDGISLNMSLPFVHTLFKENHRICGASTTLYRFRAGEGP